MTMASIENRLRKQMPLAITDKYSDCQLFVDDNGISCSAQEYLEVISNPENPQQLKLYQYH